MTKRWIAYKVGIKDLVNANYLDGSVQIGNLNVNRVRIMGTVVAKYDQYNFIVLDDGSETIRVKAFEDSKDLIKKVNVGDIAEVFGRVREYNGEIYIIPEIIKKIEDPNWYILRKLELMKLRKKQQPKKEEKSENEESSEEEIIVEEEIEVVEETLEENPKQKVKKIISELDKGEGAEIEEIIKESGLDRELVEEIISDMMSDGEIFEPRPGKVKLL